MLAFALFTCLACFLLAPSPARATPNFPGVIADHLDLSAVPDCSLCHAGPQQRGTVTTPFGTTMQSRGLVAYDEDKLKLALDALDAEKKDSDGDGRPDTTELREGSDPNAAGEGAPVPEYGCQAAPTPAPLRRGYPLAPAALTIVLAGVFLGRRLRTASGGSTFSRRPMAPPESTADTLAERFYAGRYAEVLALTVDRPELAYSDAELPFVCGALAFVGRIEEARAVLGSVRGSADLIAARFFLAVALCRAGRSAAGEREFRANLRAGYRHPDARVRFYVFQGLACLRYFGGRMDRAARLSLRALAAAYEARFQYGRLLATDLRGHALIQLGMSATGLQLLEQARSLGTFLGLEGNANAIACASAVYAARAGLVPLDAAIAKLESVAREASTQDSYSVRSVEVELARQYALAGRSDEGWVLLERIAARPAADGDRRLRARLMLAFAAVALLRHGRSSAQTYVSEARALVATQDDLGLEADVLRLELACAPDDAGLKEKLAAVERRIGIDRRRPSNVEDRMGAILTNALAGSSEDARRAFDAGYLGLLPIALRRDPGRFIVLADEGRLVVADGGNVRVCSDVAPACLRLLAALADGVWHDKADLVHRVWGLRVYRPERHASVVHTAISRLRATLVMAGHWIEARAGAYRLSPDVFVIVDQGCDDGAPFDMPDTPEPDTADESAAPGGRGAEAAPSDEKAAIESHLAAAGPASTGDLARVLRVSEMTVLRRLKELVREGRVIRTGRGRATRYEIASANAPDEDVDQTQELQ